MPGVISFLPCGYIPGGLRATARDQALPSGRGCNIAPVEGSARPKLRGDVFAFSAFRRLKSKAANIGAPVK